VRKKKLSENVHAELDFFIENNQPILKLKDASKSFQNIEKHATSALDFLIHCAFPLNLQNRLFHKIT